MAFKVNKDPSVVAFIKATRITNGTQYSAINYLVLALKASNLWNKMIALYPFVGGTATTHKYNLKSPTTFELTFNGGWTHSTTGGLPNGTTGYADTQVNPSSHLSLDSTHVSYYSRTQSANYAGVEMGIWAGGAGASSTFRFISVCYKYSDGTGINAINQINVAPSLPLQYTNISGITTGHLIGTRTGSNTIKSFHNKTLVFNATASSTSPLPSINIYIGARNKEGTGGDLFSNKECAFTSIGQGLTDSESSIFSDIIQKYQTILNRQI